MRRGSCQLQSVAATVARARGGAGHGHAMMRLRAPDPAASRRVVANTPSHAQQHPPAAAPRKEPCGWPCATTACQAQLTGQRRPGGAARAYDMAGHRARSGVGVVHLLLLLPSMAVSGLDCRWTVNDHDRPGHLFGRLSPTIRTHLSDATLTVYPGSGAGFVAHPTDMLEVRPYEYAAGRMASVVPGNNGRHRVSGECTDANNTDSYERYYHSLAAPSVGECCAACAKDPTCTFAAWALEVHIGGKCWLKNSTTMTPRASPGTTLLTVNGRPAPPPPPVLSWHDAWERNLVTGPAAMAALVVKELNGTHPGLLMIDYEPPFSASWNFSTDFSTKPDALWRATLASVHNESFDTNWTNLVGWGIPQGAHSWDDLTASQRLSLQAVSWDFFCQRYFAAGIRAIKAALPPNVLLSFWNWPNVRPPSSLVPPSLPS
jgi:hypothetical protein